MSKWLKAYTLITIMLALISYNVAYFFVLGWVGEEGQGEEGGGGGGGGRNQPTKKKTLTLMLGYSSSAFF